MLTAANPTAASSQPAQNENAAEMQMQPSLTVQSLRMHIPLNLAGSSAAGDSSINTFNISALTRLHTERIRNNSQNTLKAQNDFVVTEQDVSAAASSVIDLHDLDREEQQETANNTQTASQTKKNKKGKQRKVDPEDEYDLDDDFIDDSEMYIESMPESTPLPSWDYGFFIWHGPVENFFEKHQNKRKGVGSGVMNGKKIGRTGKTTATAVVTRSGSAPPTPASGSAAARADASVHAKTIDDAGASKPQKQKQTEKNKLAKAVSTGSVTNFPSPSSSSVNASKNTNTNKNANVNKSSSNASANKPSLAQQKAASGSKSAPTNAAPSAKPQQVVSDNTLPSTLVEALNRLNSIAATKSFADKKQFPGSLIAPLRDCVWIAMDHNIHNASDSPFYAALAKILPYTVLVLRKIVMKLLFPDRMRSIKEQVTALYKDMEQSVIKSVMGLKPVNPKPSTGDDSVDGGTDASQSSSPTKFKWTDEIRAQLWNILCLEWELADLDNTCNTLNGKKPKFIETAVRRAVYGKLCTFWPAGTMDGNQMSREYSKFRNRVQKQAARPESVSEVIVAEVPVKRDPFTAVVMKNSRSSSVNKSLSTSSSAGPSSADTSTLTPIAQSSPSKPPSTPKSNSSAANANQSTATPTQSQPFAPSSTSTPAPTTTQMTSMLPPLNRVMSNHGSPSKLHLINSTTSSTNLPQSSGTGYGMAGDPSIASSLSHDKKRPRNDDMEVDTPPTSGEQRSKRLSSGNADGSSMHPDNVILLE